MLPQIEVFDFNTLTFLFAAGSLGRFALYLLFAGIAFALVWKVGRGFFRRFQIQKKLAGSKIIREEIIWSASTVLIWSVLAIPFLWLYSRGYTKIYTDINEYPAWYYWLGFPLVVFLHDGYFYWTHRAMHHPRLFRLMHARHHRSRNPSPWAIFSFHPLEAIVAFNFVLITCVVPMHVHVFAFWNVFMIAFNVMGHLGHEFFPAGWVKWPVARALNTSTHHNLHHMRVRGNFGLYFTIWDRISGTMFEDYEERFDQVKNGVAL